MSLIVACPNCQTRYNLPEKFAGKKLKCKSCGKPFAATVGAARGATAPTNQSSPQQQQIDPQELQKLGIGAIRQQPDPFAGPANLGPDPLRNHVVQDPGFGIPGNISGAPDQATPDDEDSDSGLDPEYDSVVSNPYIKAPKVSAHGSGGDSEQSRGSGKGKKKRKKKVHSAVKDSLDKATMTLLIIGVLIALLFGFFFISAYSDAMTDIKNINTFAIAAGDEGMTDAAMEEMATENAASRRIGSGIGILIGVVFMVLGAGVQIFPITCSITGLVVYIIFELAFCILLFDIFSISGWIRRVVVCTALGKAFMDAMNARYYDQMMEEKRKSGR